MHGLFLRIHIFQILCKHLPARYKTTMSNPNFHYDVIILFSRRFSFSKKNLKAWERSLIYFTIMSLCVFSPNCEHISHRLSSSPNILVTINPTDRFLPTDHNHFLTTSSNYTKQQEIKLFYIKHIFTCGLISHVNELA